VVDQGDLLRYTLRITNTGAVTATRVVVTDTIPGLGAYTLYAPPADGSAGVMPGSAGDWYVTHPNGSDYVQWGTLDAVSPIFAGLPPDGSAELYFEVRVRQPLPDQLAIANSSYAAQADNAARVDGEEITTLVNAPHWSIAKEAAPGTVSLGDGQPDVLTYTIRVSNDGHLDAAGRYTITDRLPDYTAYLTSQPEAGLTGDVLTWVFSETLAVGAGREVSYRVQVTDPLTDGLSIVNHTYAVTGSNVYTGAAGVPVTTPVQAPRLRIDKTDWVDPIWPGGLLTYTLAYTNSGGAAAADVTLSETFDANTTFVGSLPPPTGGVGDARYWDLGTLPAGASGSVVVTVSVDSPLPSGTLLTNQAGVASPYGYADQDVETTLVEGTPVLHLIKKASTATAEPGDLITYTLSYSNSGDAPAVGVLLTDTLDPNTTLVDATPGYTGQYVWDLGDVWPSATHQVTVTVRVTDSLTDGTVLTNHAAIESAGGITDTAEALVVVDSAPILRLVKEASTGIVQPGDALTYTIWYSNTGNAPATDAVITDTLPAELYDAGGGHQQVWNVGTVEVGRPYSLTLAVTASSSITDGWLLVNQVAMSSAETGTVTAGETVAVHAVDLVVDKTASAAVVKAGELVTYTITVRNAGHAAAHNLRITDTLPTHIVPGSVVSSASAGLALETAAFPSYVWTAADLAPLAEATISIRGRLVTSPWPAGGDDFWNTVEVKSEDNERDFSRNADDQVVTGRPGDPYTITLAAGPVPAEVGNTVALTATVTDRWGNPAYDYAKAGGTLVSFAASLGSPLPGAAGTQGGAAYSTLSSTQPGAGVVTATVNGLVATAPVTFTAGPLDHFIIDPIASPQAAGVPFTVAITAVDRFGNRLADYTGSAVLDDTTGTGTPASVDFTGGAWSGPITITGAMRGNLITATDALITGRSNAFDVQPGPADSATLAVTSPMPPCGATSVHTATVRDEYGNPLWSGTPVTFLLTDIDSTGAGLVPSSPYVDTTDDAGRATATIRSAAGLGRVRLEVDLDGDFFPETSQLVQVAGVGPAADLQLAAAPASIAVGGTSLVTATLRDCLGQPVAGAPVNLSASGLGGLSVTSGATNASGVLTSTFAADWTPGVATVTASSGSLVDSTPITITGGPILAVAKSASPASGTTVPVTATITYFIVVTNTGDPATNFVLTDPIPANSQYVPGSLRVSSWATPAATNPVRVTAGTFAGAGQVLTVTFAVSPTGGGAVQNQVSIRSDQTAPQTSNPVDHTLPPAAAKNLFLPLVLNNWKATAGPIPTNANLVVEDIRFSGSAPAGDGDLYHVQVTVRNVGTEPATGNFWVDLYLNPAGTPAVNQPWQNVSQSGELGVAACAGDPTCYGRAWYVTEDLSPGEAVVLSTQMAPDQRYDRWPAGGVPYVGRRHTPILALVDSWGDSYGAIYERDETDNLSASLSAAGAHSEAARQDAPAFAPPAPPAGSQRPTLPVK
jgi:uncharacterized repeat protein (TIGR01451 family)